MQSKINTTPITQYIQMLRAAELSQQKELKIPIQQARLLNLALAEMMEKINRDYESLFHDLKKSIDTEVISVRMDGGGFEE
jgi:hypothetical protein